MKRDTIPEHIKTTVAQRAGLRCEYCLLPDKITFFSFHIDHIISLKHGGVTHIDNLAYCCPECNYYKGSDIASLINEKILTRFFHPRNDKWSEHFFLSDGTIVCKTDVARATERIFKFNEIERLIFRRQLILQNLYP